MCSSHVLKLLLQVVIDTEFINCPHSITALYYDPFQWGEWTQSSWNSWGYKRSLRPEGEINQGRNGQAGRLKCTLLFDEDKQAPGGMIYLYPSEEEMQVASSRPSALSSPIRQFHTVCLLNGWWKEVPSKWIWPICSLQERTMGGTVVHCPTLWMTHGRAIPPYLFLWKTFG